MFGFLKPVKRLVVVACLFLTLWTAAEVVTVRITADAVNQIKDFQFADVEDVGGFWSWLIGGSIEARTLRWFVLLLAMVTVGMGVVGYLREVASSRLSMTMVYYIREAVYDKLQRVGLGFHDSVSTGELINRALTDLQHVRMFVNNSLLLTLEIVLIVGGYEILLMLRSPWVAGLALTPIPIWVWYILRFSKKAQPALQATLESNDQNVSLITENIAGVHVVKAFATEQQEIAKYDQSCDDFLGKVLHRIRLFANFMPIMRGISTAAHLTLFLAAGILIIKGQLQAGDILMLGAAMGAILGRLQQVAMINEQYQHAIVSAKRLREILAADATAPETLDAPPLPDGPGAVRFENVTFGYDADNLVIRDVSFEVPGGSVVAIVGPTGAGKTTLVSLLSRFYDPLQGRILIDGVDIRDVSLDSLRTNVSYVFQETYLFSASVQANIAFGRPGASMDEVEEAARLAQAHDFVQDLPKGYDTTLGERGTTLSGGQRQRLAIARAIFANPRVLVLDDATAAVDPDTEQEIRKALGGVMASRTTFIIAHRISTVRNADVVLVLEDGQLTQMGTHDELLTQEGHYRQIVNLQLFGDADVDTDGVPLSHMDRMRELSRRGDSRPHRPGGEA